MSSICERKFFHHDVIQLADRILSPKDIVSRISNSTVRGCCLEVTTSVDVQIIGTPYVIKNVPVTRLSHQLYIGECVLLDTWIGRTDKIQWKLLLKMPCGALVETLVEDIDDFSLQDPIMENRKICFATTVFYPGQRLKGLISSLKNGKWITPKPSHRDNQRITFIVRSVEVNDVWVKWQLNMKNIKSQADNNDSRPNEHLTGDDLKRLKRINQYEDCVHRIEDIGSLKITEDDLASVRSNVISKTQWIKEVSEHYKDHQVRDDTNAIDIHQNTEIVESTSLVENYDDDDGWQTDDSYSQLLRRSTSNRRKKLIKDTKRTLTLLSSLPKIGDELSVETILVHSQATVIWEDGTIESGISPTQLYPMTETNDNEYFPGDCVTTANVSSDSISTNYGIVQKFNRTERMVIVKWLRTYIPSDAQNISEPQFVNETESSVYDLKFHRKMFFELESVVVRTVDFDEKDARSAVGLVINKDTAGRINVKWNNGQCNICWPQDLVSLSSLLNKKSNSENYSHEGENMKELDESIEMETLDLCKSLSDRLEHFYQNHINIFEKSQFKSTDEVMQAFVKLCNEGRFIDRVMSTSFFVCKSVLSNIKKLPSLLTQKLDKFFPDNVFDKSESSDVKSTDESVTSETNSCLLHIQSSDTTMKELFEDLSNKSHDSGNHSKTESGSSSSPNDSTTDLKLNDDSSSFVSESLQFSELVSWLSFHLKVSLKKALKEMNRRLTISESEAAGKFNMSNVDEIGNSEDTETAAVNPDNPSNVVETSGSFMVLENAPSSHKFFSTIFQPINSQQYQRGIQFDHKMLRKSLPPGVWVLAYEDRIDLLSVMIRGVEGTPYEDGIFLFDIQLGEDYPYSPPSCHYISFCSGRLNPNLYVDGKICVSLLGTWDGEGSELWSYGCTLLQVIVSIQGLILVAEPYFNEVGLDKHIGTQEGLANSQMYNEMVVLKLIESMTKLLSDPPEVFRSEIVKHFCHRGDAMYQRINGWMDSSNEKFKTEFPLVPTSRGFCLRMVNLLGQFRNKLDAINQ